MKLISWNIQWGLGADGRVDLDRIVEHARRLADFDVLCLQEVASGYPDLTGNDGSDQFQALADRLPGFVAIAGPAVDASGPTSAQRAGRLQGGPEGTSKASNGKRRQFGNMIFSRFPILQIFRHLLPWPAEAGVKSMQRAALEATLDTPLGLVRVISTHLEYYSPAQRMAQVERLRELHREASAQSLIRKNGDGPESPFFPQPRGRTAIIAGDFNFRADSAERARMMALFDDGTPRLLDAWEIARPGEEHEPTVGLFDKAHWPGPPFLSDFVFVSEDLKPYIRTMRVDSVSNASDHQPVLLELGYGRLPA